MFSFDLVKMRVIAGRWKGSKLRAGKFEGFRPVTDRIKESVFGTLGENVFSANVLDLFAGSGSFGIEALSRGAAMAVFVEWSSPIVQILHNNLRKIKCEPSEYEIIISDAFKVLPALRKRQLKFDLIFVDPPFRKPVANQSLKFLSGHELLRREGVLVLRHHKSEDVVSQVDGLSLIRAKAFGDSVLKYYAKET